MRDRDDVRAREVKRETGTGRQRRTDREIRGSTDQKLL